MDLFNTNRVHLIFDEVATRNVVDVEHAHLQKAFHKVFHSKLVSKTEIQGVK